MHDKVQTCNWHPFQTTHSVHAVLTLSQASFKLKAATLAKIVPNRWALKALASTNCAGVADTKKMFSGLKLHKHPSNTTHPVQSM
jgi:hypothetical protein